MELLSLGFKYLGYYLKPLGYCVKDWRWFIKKIEKMISNWTYRLLSLGGRLILVKSVLLVLAVYWLSLACMPRSILNYIQRSIFNFLWGNSNGNSKLHLVDWYTISIPYEFGVWNIKNLDWFSLALRLKIFWMVLNGEGIWSLIVKHKYLKNNFVDVWLCQQVFIVQGTSYIWNGFISAISWITRCLGWKVWNGRSIKISIDPIVGLSSDYILPEDLMIYLEDYGIAYLSDAHNSGIGASSHAYWLTAEDLDLGGHWKETWSNYIDGLPHGCIRLGEGLDSLVWMFNKRNGTTSAKLAYNLITSSTLIDRPGMALILVWKCNISLKVICFNWLCLSNRINTWDN